MTKRDGRLAVFRPVSDFSEGSGMERGVRPTVQVLATTQSSRMSRVMFLTASSAEESLRGQMNQMFPFMESPRRPSRICIR